MPDQKPPKRLQASVNRILHSRLMQEAKVEDRNLGEQLDAILAERYDLPQYAPDYATEPAGAA